jgi:hypothetical protein
MIIKLFKLFESRSSEISDEEFRKILKDNCKDFLKNPIFLQRSKENFTSKISFIDPSKHTRTALKSDNSGTPSNHHLLLMDNLKSWKEFPKRHKSLIGNTNPLYSVCYGTHRYLVIPFDGALFGVAPGEDLWVSRANIIGNKSNYSGAEIMFDDSFCRSMIRSGVRDSTYNEMISDLQDTMNSIKNNDLRKLDKIDRYLHNLLSIFNDLGYNDVEEALNKHLSPDKFVFNKVGFKSMGYNELVNHVGNSKLEFWTESPCLLYYIGEFGFRKKFHSGDMDKTWLDFIDEYVNF